MSTLPVYLQVVANWPGNKEKKKKKRSEEQTEKEGKEKRGEQRGTSERREERGKRGRGEKNGERKNKDKQHLKQGEFLKEGAGQYGQCRAPGRRPCRQLQSIRTGASHEADTQVVH